MSRRAIALGVLATSGMLVLLSAASPAAAGTAPSPTLTILNEPFPDDAIAQGSTFKVEGTGWPTDTLVQLEVCGNEARSGTSDCAADTGQVVASNATGVFQGRLAVVIPPTPCPCVIRAVSQTTTDSVTTPVDIPNAPTSHPGDGDVVAPALRRLEVEKVRMRGEDSWNTWLGGPARRTFEFEVVNTGSVAVDEATVVLTAGPADDPTGFLKPVKIERLEVGERRKITVPVEFQALAFGDQAVRATVNGTSVPVSFRATTSTHPWLLVIVPALIIGQLLLLGIRNIVRRRLQDDEVATPVMIAAVDGPADSSLICVVEYTETTAAPAATPEVDTAPAAEPATADSSATDSFDDAAVETFAEGLVVGDDVVGEDVLADPDDDELDAQRASDDAAADTDGDGQVTVAELVAATAEPTVQHHTMVIRSITAVKDLVRESLTVTDGSAPTRTINAITVLADEDARVGDAHRACDDLCVWIDAAFTDAGAPLSLRRRHVTAANAGMGMVPLSVLVRAVHQAA